MRFSPGDKVVCVDQGFCKRISDGNIYTVLSMLFHGDFVSLKELPGEWYTASRFRKIDHQLPSLEDML